MSRQRRNRARHSVRGQSRRGPGRYPPSTVALDFIYSSPHISRRILRNPDKTERRQCGRRILNPRIFYIASNTFREAVRDRVLYNLIAFALLMSGAAVLVGQISIGIERLVVINLGLSAVSLFGIVISIFIGIGLVSKEIDKRTLYTVLSRPVRRWEFLLGKFLGLSGTLVVNSLCMAAGVYAALVYVSDHHHLLKTDSYVLVALYFIVLQFVMVTALAL